MSALADAAAEVSWPDYDAATRAHDALIGRPELGRLAELVEWLAGTQARFPVNPITRPRLVVVAADHAIASTGVSRWRADDTTRTVSAIRSGTPSLCELGAVTGAGIRVETLPSGLDTEAAAQQGVALTDAEVDAGTDLFIIGNLGAGSTTMAAAVIAVLTATEPVKVVGRGGSRIDDLAWMHKVAAIRDARRRGWPHRDDPAGLVAELGCPDLAFVAGMLLRAAARRVPVLIDGTVTAAAALVANTMRTGAARWWQAAQLTGEPAQAIALGAMNLVPVENFAMATGDGSGGLVALSALRAGLALAGTGATPDPPDAPG